MRTPIRWATGLVAVLAIAGIGLTARVQPGTAAPPRRPNILFLFADDMRADTIAAHGNPHIRTPTLDDLARRGVSFRGGMIGHSGLALSLGVELHKLGLRPRVSQP